MDSPYNQIPKQKLLIDYLAMETMEFQEERYHRSEQQEGELQQLREKYHDKQKKLLIDKQQLFLIDSLSKKLTTFQEQWDQRIKQEE